MLCLLMLVILEKSPQVPGLLVSPRCTVIASENRGQKCVRLVFIPRGFPRDCASLNALLTYDI